MKYHVTPDVLQKDFTKFTRKGSFACNKNRLLICAAPKSGSTYVHKICTTFPDYSNCNLVPNVLGGRENELCIRKLVMSHQGFDNYASRLHLRYSNVTRDLISQFDLKPIVLTRNIFDSVCSIYDFYYIMKDNNGIEKINTIDMNGHTHIMPKDFFDWEEIRQLNFIVDMVIPWYFNFLISWLYCENAFWIRYENLVSDPFVIISGLNSYYKLNLSDENIRKAIAKADAVPEQTKKNQAVVGRGAALPNEVKEKIYIMAGYYKEYDLSPFGL